MVAPRTVTLTDGGSHWTAILTEGHEAVSVTAPSWRAITEVARLFLMGEPPYDVPDQEAK